MNTWRDFEALLPADPLLIGEVTAHNADGTSTVELPSGDTLRVRGQGVSVGNNAFVQTGQVQGEAPDLPVVSVEI